MKKITIEILDVDYYFLKSIEATRNDGVVDKIDLIDALAGKIFHDGVIEFCDIMLNNLFSSDTLKEFLDPVDKEISAWEKIKEEQDE